MKSIITIKWRVVFLALIIIFIILGFVVTCGLFREGYNTFNSKKYDDTIRIGDEETIFTTLPLFTFNYPRSYSLSHSDVITVSDDSAVLEYRKMIFTSFFKPLIRILVVKMSDNTSGVTLDVLINGKIHRYQSDANFQIIEEGFKNISGNQAKYVSFSCYGEVDKGLKEPLQERIERYSCFESNGGIWEIEMQTFKDEDEEAARQYQHLIDTFKISK